jgi:hypothetical protein
MDDNHSPNEAPAAPSASSNTMSTDLDDATLISQAEEHFAEERYLKAAACFKSVRDTGLLTDKHNRIVEMAAMAATVRDVLLLPNPETEGWKKQGETHGHRDTVIYYKVNPDNAIVSRIETPIESSLLCPLLSVFNETDLFHTWMPKWKVPRLGVSDSVCLKEMGRGHQIVKVLVDMPYPFDNRECIQHAFAVDSIEDDNAIIVKIDSLDTGKHLEIEIEEVAPGYRRVDFHAGILIRPCPPDHPTLKHSKNQYPEGEKLLLVSVVQQMDANIARVPIRLINFFTRNVLGQMWGNLLQIAEDVKNGKRPEHQEMIASKQDLYGWIEKRVSVMIASAAAATEVAAEETATEDTLPL